MLSKAMVFTAVGQPLELREFPVTYPGPGGMWVKVAMSTICGSDLHTTLGTRPAPVPIILGHEITGSVAALGKGVTTDTMGRPLKEGDRITWTIFANCGNCYFCKIKSLPMKCLKLFKYGHECCTPAPHLNGGYAEYCYIIPGTFVFKIPDSISDEEITPANCGLATIMQGCDEIKINPEDHVVIQGAGLLGIYAAAVAKERGAGKVIIIDMVPERLEMAKRFGADVAVNSRGLRDEDLIASIMEQTEGWGADVILELAGTPKVLPAGLKMLRKGGRYSWQGNVFPNATFPCDAYDIITRWITIRGFHNYDALQLAEAVAFIERTKDKYPFRDLVGCKLPLADLARGLKIAEERKAVRAAICPGLPATHD
jgi:putative phosphonate catabolism associated alcohol dehydrogenase